MVLDPSNHPATAMDSEVLVIRRLTLVLVVVAVTFGVASAASAQQYPPNGTTTTAPGTAVEGAGVDRNPGGTSVQGAGVDQGSDNGSGSGSSSGGAPLVRTGMDIVPLVLLGAALIAGGAFWMVSAKRVRTARTPA